MKTIKEMRNEIKQKYDAIPEKQISPGYYLSKIGRKYVSILTTWGTTSLIKQTVEEFYNNRL